MSTYGSAEAHAAAATIRARLSVRSPAAAIVLGTGLGSLADVIEDARRIPYAEVPGFHATAVPGHRGEVIVGTLGGREVIAFAGRFHIYEGHSARAAAFPVRVAHALGARVLLLSNAAGGINAKFQPGDLMVIEDHINLTGRNPLVGPVEPGDIRFPDMSAPYATRLRELFRTVAAERHIAITSGVYAGLLGPTYETPAEVRMLATLGADAVGMSTVVETIAAAAMGMDVGGVSLITNKAAGLDDAVLSHADVMAAGDQAAARFVRLIEGVVARL